MSFYQRRGLQPVINAATTLPTRGGSPLPARGVPALNDAAGALGGQHEPDHAAGPRLAELTKNEAAYVTSGCAPALVLSVLGIRTGGDPSVIAEYPGHADAPHEVIMHAAHRIPYDPAIALAGGTIRHIGNVLQTYAWELAGALTDHTDAQS